MDISLPSWLPSIIRDGPHTRSAPRAMGAALDLLFPPTCAVCRGEGRFLHDACESALGRLEKPHCPLCARPGWLAQCSWCVRTAPAFDGVAAPYLMEDAVREMVYDLKYRNIRALAPVLGRLMVAHMGAEAGLADALVAVPLHRHRERDRGYNQSGLLARVIHKQTGIPLMERSLRRTRDTQPQVSITEQDKRRANMEGAFTSSGDVMGLRVALIDDVVTTGSTMSACAHALKAAGATSVRGLAFARQG